MNSRFSEASGSIRLSIWRQLLALAVERPRARATPSTDGTSVATGAIELSTSPCPAASTPRSIDACTGRVQGGSIVRAVKQPPPSRTRPHRFDMRSGLMYRGATPSSDTSRTGGTLMRAPVGRWDGRSAGRRRCCLGLRRDGRSAPAEPRPGPRRGDALLTPGDEGVRPDGLGSLTPAWPVPGAASSLLRRERRAHVGGISGPTAGSGAIGGTDPTAGRPTTGGTGRASTTSTTSRAGTAR